jgi:hypothetical protein
VTRGTRNKTLSPNYKQTNNTHQQHKQTNNTNKQTTRTNNTNKQTTRTNNTNKQTKHRNNTNNTTVDKTLQRILKLTIWTPLVTGGELGVWRIHSSFSTSGPTWFPYQIMFVSISSNIMGATSGEGTVYPSNPEFTSSY